MVRRRLTLKRIDPWSVLKFGFVANLSLLAILLLGGAVMWFFVRRLRLIEKVCDIALDVGFTSCGVNGGNLFRAMLLLGLLGVVIQTGLAVFFAFLANLIAEVTGGLSFTFADETAGAAGRGEVTTPAGRSRTTDEHDRTTRSRPPQQGSGSAPPKPLGTQNDPIFGSRPERSSGDPARGGAESSESDRRDGSQGS